MRLDFFKNKYEAVAKERVYGKSVDERNGSIYEFWSDQAEYFGKEKKLVLTGETQPRVKQTEGKSEKRVTGDKIIYYIDSRDFIAEGDAKAVFYDPEAKDKAK